MKKLLQSLLFVGLTLLLFDGCNGVSPLPGIGETKKDPKLPKVDLTKNGIIVDMNQIAFEWKPIKNPNVGGVKIYRSSGDENKTSLLTTIENRYSTHYVDLDVKPDTLYNYEFRTYKDDAVSAKIQRVHVFSKPPLPSVSWIYAQSGLPRMAKILWRPHKNRDVEKYIIERKTFNDSDWEKIATIKGRLQAEYIDTGLKDRHTYLYRVRVKTFDDILSTPSEIVKVITKQLPPEITGLQATTDLPKKIFLTWNKSNYKDFERYYLYRSDSKDGSYKLIAKLYNNRFIDNIGKDGARFFYKVSQKDIDGLESPKDDFIVMGATLPKPDAPVIVDARFDGSVIHLKWSKVDPRSKSYIVERRAKAGWFNEKVDTFKTKAKSFIDKNLTPNTKYEYVVYAIDGNGIVSEPSEPVKVEVTEVRVPTKISNKPKAVLESVDEAKEISPVDDLEVDSK